MGRNPRAPLRDASGAITAALGITRDITDRKAADDRLQESEERLRLALDAAHMGTFDWDVLANRISWSRGHEKIWGFATDEFAGTYESFAGRVHPDDLPGVDAEVATCMAERRPYEREFRVVWPDGSIHWVVGRGEFDFDDGGRAVRMRGVVLETTSRKRAEARIVKLNRVHAMLSGINETIVRVRDAEKVLAEACRLAADAGGYQMAWIGLMSPGGRLEVRAHAHADPATLDIIRSLIRDDPPGGCSFTAVALREGRHAVCHDVALDPRAASWRAAALARGYGSMAALPLKTDGRVVGTFNLYAAEAGVFDEEELRLLDELATDISFALDVHQREQERQRAEAGRAAAQERLRQVVENIQEVFWITDPAKQQMLYVSPAYEMIWGRTCASLFESPRTWLDAIHADDRDRVALAAQTQTTGQYHETYRILRPDGSVRWIRDRAFPVRNAAGEVDRIVGTATDVTEQRLLEEQPRRFIGKPFTPEDLRRKVRLLLDEA